MGSHPDAGASFYLSRLPGYLGEVYFFQFAKHSITTQKKMLKFNERLF